jgi:hypothetical protein
VGGGALTILRPGDRPDVLQLDWSGRWCPIRAVITIRGVGDGLGIALDEGSGRPECVEQREAHRRVEVQFDRAVHDLRVEVERVGWPSPL